MGHCHVMLQRQRLRGSDSHIKQPFGYMGDFFAFFRSHHASDGLSCLFQIITTCHHHWGGWLFCNRPTGTNGSTLNAMVCLYIDSFGCYAIVNGSVYAIHAYRNWVIYYYLFNICYTGWQQITMRTVQLTCFRAGRMRSGLCIIE